MMHRVGAAAGAGRAFVPLGVISQVIPILAVLGILVTGGWLAWADEATVAKGDVGEDLSLVGPRPLNLAPSCPAVYTDGNPRPADINIRSCHTQLITCQRGESPIRCGKRALMSGDWETALEAFDRAASRLEEDFGEAIYGRYLARLFRLYADYNNMFFGDAFGEGFNQTHLTRDLHDWTLPQGYVFMGHHACLANEVYIPPNLLFSKSHIDIDLQLIVQGHYHLSGLEGGALPIRWVQGNCEAPIFDVEFRGNWDFVDAVLMYVWLYGSPAEAERFLGILGPADAPSRTPCLPDDQVCKPLVKDGQPIPRLPRDAERLAKFYFPAHQAFFNLNRFPPGQEPIFFVHDVDGDGSIDGKDGITVNIFKTGTDVPVLAIENTTLAAQWTPRKADPPVNPAPANIFIFCPEGKESPHCQEILLPGDGVIAAAPPVWKQLSDMKIPTAPSPDNTQIVFPRQVEQSGTKVWQFFVTDNALDAQGHPICSAPGGDCCLTCKVLPGGIRQALADASQRNPPGPPAFWIPDPANPKGPARGIFFQHNEHPSSWGFGGQAQGTQFFAIRPDRTKLSRLLTAPPDAFHYQPRISPNGAQLLWVSTWDPVNNRAGGHTLLLADLVEESDRFTLAKVHSIVPIRDHGWYETGGFAQDYPQDPRVFFTSSSTGMQEVRIYAATLTPEGVIDEVFKLTFPDEIFPEPFTIDFHEGWYEFPTPVDHGKQFFFLTSYTRPLAMDRFDRLFSFPPLLTGVLVGLTVFDIRFVGGNRIAYLENLTQSIANIDGTNLRGLFTESIAKGWKVTGNELPVVGNEIFFTQTNKALGTFRQGVVRFIQ